MSARGGARVGSVIGAWAGVLDGASVLHLSGPAPERLGAMGVAILVDALVAAALLGALGALAGRLRRRAEARSGRGAGPVRVVLLLGALVVGGGLALREPPAHAPAPSAASHERPHVVLISIDTLRVDHLEAYGYGRETSPHLTRIAQQGVLFETAYSHSTWTLPAHVSMLTGLDPFEHGVEDDRHRVHPKLETLAERLRASGYTTAAWVGTPPAGYVGARFGLADGFGIYRHAPHPRRFRTALVPRLLDALLLQHVRRGVGNASAQVDAVISWLRTSPRSPIFLFVHLYDVHSRAARLPYEAPEPYRTRFCPDGIGAFTGCLDGRCASDRLIAIADGQQPGFDDEELELVRCLYDGGIAYVDAEIGRLLAAFERLRPGEPMALVVTSDHGEAFLEHGLPLHVTLHDEVTRIPLIVRVEGGAAGKRVTGVVSLSDIAPTILELAGAGPAPGGSGRSLVPVLRDWPAGTDRVVLATDDGRGGTLIRSGALKLIEHRDAGSGTSAGPRLELFDLTADAGETLNRLPVDPEAAARLAELLRARRAAGAALQRSLVGDAPAERIELSDGEREALRALGYVDGPGVDVDAAGSER